MPVIGPSIPEYQYYPDAPPSLVGLLSTGLTVNIELWKGSERINVDPNHSGCAEIGDTGRYVWSLAYLPKLAKSREQYHFRMTDGAVSDEGDFIMVNPHGLVGMPEPSEESSYLIRG